MLVSSSFICLPLFLINVTILMKSAYSFMPSQHSGRAVASLTAAASGSSDEKETHAGLTMESLRDLLHRKRADLLEEVNDASSDTSGTKVSAASASDRVQEMLLSTRLSSLMAILNNTRVDTSTLPNAGRGLFATRAIRANEVITCYPGDALLISKPLMGGDFDFEGQDEENDDDWVEETVIWGSHVDPSNRWDEDAVFDGNEEQNPLTHYACAISDTFTVMGLPALDDDAAYLGHFANDGAGHIALGQGDPTRGVEESISSYVIESVEISNAMHKEVDGLHMATIATRDIAVDEEILVTYGPEYWLEII